MRKLFTIFCVLIAAGATAQTPNFYSKNCIPSYQYPCNNTNNVTGYYGITNFKTTGGTLNINNTTTCGTQAANYQYYTGTGMLFQAPAGATCSLSVKTNVPGAAYIARWAVWIDWNHDDSFDNNTFLNASGSNLGEIIATGVNSTAIGFKVPPLAKNGLTRLRVRSFGTAATAPNPNGSNVLPSGEVNPCLTLGNIKSGETEDYDVFIDNPCVKIPSVSFTNTNYKGTDVSWVPKGNEQWFEYRVDTSPNTPGGGNTLLKPSITSLHLPDTFMKFLPCATKFYFHIRGICDTLDGKNQANWYYGPWRLDSFTTDPCCDMPDANISNITSNSALASWGPVTSVQNYEYQIRIDTIVPTHGTIINNTNVLLPGLACSKEYYFFLRALCSPTPQSDWMVDSFLTQPCLGIDNAHSMPNFTITAYPNPVKDVVTLSVMHGIKHSDADITVTDITGKEVLHTIMTGDKIDVDLREQATGIYLVKYADEQRTQIVKISKQ